MGEQSVPRNTGAELQTPRFWDLVIVSLTRGEGASTLASLLPSPASPSPTLHPPFGSAHGPLHSLAVQQVAAAAAAALRFKLKQTLKTCHTLDWCHEE